VLAGIHIRGQQIRAEAALKVAECLARRRPSRNRHFPLISGRLGGRLSPRSPLSIVIILFFFGPHLLARADKLSHPEFLPPTLFRILTAVSPRHHQLHARPFRMKTSVRDREVCLGRRRKCVFGHRSRPLYSFSSTRTPPSPSSCPISTSIEYKSLQHARQRKNLHCRPPLTGGRVGSSSPRDVFPN